MKMEIFKKYGKDDVSDFSIREIKYARARVGLLFALFSELKKYPASEIKIKDLCRIAEVSEPSFYNYFPKKDDLFYYFVRLWSVDSYLYCKNTKEGLSAITKFYIHTGQTAEAHPYLMKELLSYQVRENIPQRAQYVPAITLAEKTLLFGRIDGLESVPDEGIRALILYHVKIAMENGELPGNCKLQEAVLSIASVFFGIAGLCALTNFEKLSTQYVNSLKVVYSGLKNSYGVVE